MIEIFHVLRRRLQTLPLAIALVLLAAYRTFISPLLVTIAGPACRFEPSCSEYARQALTERGLGRGLYLTLRRLLRCHPLGGWGYDPVPAQPSRDSRHPLKEQLG